MHANFECPLSYRYRKIDVSRPISLWFPGLKFNLLHFHVFWIPIYDNPCLTFAGESDTSGQRIASSILGTEKRSEKKTVARRPPFRRRHLKEMDLLFLMNDCPVAIEAGKLDAANAEAKVANCSVSLEDGDVVVCSSDQHGEEGTTEEEFLCAVTSYNEASRQYIHATWFNAVTTEVHTVNIVGNSLAQIQAEGIGNVEVRMPRIQESSALFLKTVECVQEVSHSYEIRVPKKLMGLAIGPQGAHLREAREIAGVVQIFIDDKQSVFRVCAQSAAAIHSARRRLEYCERHIQVPSQLVPAVIGKRRRKIKELKMESGVHAARVLAKPQDEKSVPREAGYLPLLLTGRKASVDKALDVFGNYLEKIQQYSNSLSDKNKTQMMHDRELANSSDHIMKVRLPRKLIGPTVGAQGRNLNKARGVMGVKRITIDDETSLFIIVGDSEQCVNEARNILEFTEDCVHIPKRFVSRVVGKQSRVLGQITQDCGLFRAKLLTNANLDLNIRRVKGKIPLVLIGMRQSVEKAKVQLQELITNLQKNKSPNMLHKS